MRPILDTLCRLLPRLLLPIRTIIQLQYLGTLQHAVRALAIQTNWLLYSNEHVQTIRSVLDDTYMQDDSRDSTTCKNDSRDSTTIIQYSP